MAAIPGNIVLLEIAATERPGCPIWIIIISNTHRNFNPIIMREKEEDGAAGGITDIFMLGDDEEDGSKVRDDEEDDFVVGDGLVLEYRVTNSK